MTIILNADFWQNKFYNKSVRDMFLFIVPSHTRTRMKTKALGYLYSRNLNNVFIVLLRKKT